ncbi:MAG TPA: CvpA family protein [Telluria sp.]|nr:CvpA family protein [Telluria sp.]
MTIFDYLVLAVLASSIVIGVFRGLVKETLSLAGWVVAFFVANAFGAKLAVMLPAAIPGEVLRLIIAFIALFIGTRLVMGLVSMAIGALITATGLSPLDRLLGAGFGLARGVVIVLAVVTVCAMTSIPQQPFWKNAQLRPAVEGTARAIRPLLPEALARHLHY